jgi:O-antigen/teichoic acid export membrane protein
VNLLKLLKYISLTPFDTSSEQGRSNERYRLAALSMSANVLSRGISMLLMVLTVSLTVPYLGAERFGVWMTVASFIGMLTFLDLGVGNALTNKVAQVSAQYNLVALRCTISGGLGFLFIIGCTMGALLFELVTILPWQWLIKTQDLSLHDEILNSAQVFAILFGSYIFTNGIQRIFAGLQRAFEGHLVIVAGSCFSLFALWIAARQEAGIAYLLIATLGSQSIANLALLLILSKRKLFTLSSIASYTRKEAQPLLHIGGLFFILQIGTMVGWGADCLIISSTLGAAQVAVFSIVQRLFQFVTQPMNILNAPLWGAYADAHSRGEKTFIKKTLIHSIFSTGIYALIVFFLLLISGGYIVRIWTDNSISISSSLLASYGAWAILDALGNSSAMFLNGCNIVKPQVWSVLSLVVFSIPIKFILINNFGLSEMLVGFAVIYLLNFTFWYGFVFRQQIRNELY